MRSFLLYACLLVLVLSGCGGSDPIGASDSLGNPEPDREATALFGGRVTLNGRVITSPDYKNAPYTTSFAGVAGEVALMTLTARGLPNATTKNVLVRISGTSTSYGVYQVKRDGNEHRLPIFISKTEPVKLIFYNSNGITIYPEAVEWSWSIRTRKPLDSAEVNDDGNFNTVSDYVLGKSISTGKTSGHTMFQRTGMYDMEDWYRVELPSRGPTSFKVLQDARPWGDWEFELSLYSADGALIATEDIFGLSHTPSTDGTFFVRVTGQPVGALKGNFQFCEYALSVSLPAIPPAWRTHTVDAAAINGVQSSLHLGRPMVSYRAGGFSKFAYATKPVPREPQDWAIHTITNNYLGQVMSFSGRVVVAGNLLYISQVAVPTTSSNWAAYPWPALGSEQMVDVGGRLAMVGILDDEIVYAQAASTFPTGVADWSTHTVITNNPGYYQIGVAALDGRTAIAHRTFADETNYLTFTRTRMSSPDSATDWESHNIASRSYLDESWIGNTTTMTAAKGSFVIATTVSELHDRGHKQDPERVYFILSWRSETADPKTNYDWGGGGGYLDSAEDPGLPLLYGDQLAVIAAPRQTAGETVIVSYESGTQYYFLPEATTIGNNSLIALNEQLAHIYGTPSGLTFAYETTGW